MSSETTQSEKVGKAPPQITQGAQGAKSAHILVKLMPGSVPEHKDNLPFVEVSLLYTCDKLNLILLFSVYGCRVLCSIDVNVPRGKVQ